MKCPIHKLIIIFIIFLFSCTDDSKINTKSIDKTSGPDEIINDFTMTLFSNSKTEWNMQADVVFRYNKDKRMVGYNVFLETMNEEDKNFYRSDSAYVNEISDILTGMGNVEIITPNGLLRTQKMIWNRKNDRIHAPEDVYVRKEDTEIWGNDLFTNSNLDYIDMKNVYGQGKYDENVGK